MGRVPTAIRLAGDGNGEGEMSCPSDTTHHLGRAHQRAVRACRADADLGGRWRQTKWAANQRFSDGDFANRLTAPVAHTGL